MSEPGRAPPSLSASSSQPAGVKRPSQSEEPSTKAAKRPKSTKACLACRAGKTRCDPDTETSPRCHRCNRLNIECSFEKSPPPVIIYAQGGSGKMPSVIYGATYGAPDGDSMPQTLTPLGNTSSASAPEGLEMRSYYMTHPVTPTSPPRTLSSLKRTSFELVTTETVSTSKMTGNANSEQWSAPINFVSELMETCHPHEQNSTAKPDDLVQSGLISPEKAELLSKIWKERYAPWQFLELAMEQARVESSTPQTSPETSMFLQAAQWTLAARHLSSTDTDPPTQGQENSTLRQKLLQILEQKTTDAILGLDRSLSAIRALLIMSTWTNALSQMKRVDVNIDSQLPDAALSRAFDGELLLSVAMHLASLMHLEQDVETAVIHRKKYRNRTPPVGEELSPCTLDRARVMIVVSIANTFLNLGKGRLSSARIPYEVAEQIFGAPALLSSRSNTGGDAHLVYFCNLLIPVLKIADLCTSGAVIHTSGVTEWARQIKEEFSCIDRLQQELSTTSSLAPPAQVVPLAVTVMTGHFLKLNLISRALRTLYRAFPDFRPGVIKRRDSDDSDDESKSHRPEQIPTEGRTWSEMLPPSMDEKARQWVHDWGMTTDGHASSVMTTALVLSRHRFEAVVSGEQIMKTMAYAPDYLLCAVLFGATYKMKVSLAMALHTPANVQAQVNRSILDRVLVMLREAAGEQTTPTSDGLADPPRNSQPSRLTNILAGRCAATLSTLLRLSDARAEERKRQAQTQSRDAQHPEHQTLPSADMSAPSGSMPEASSSRTSDITRPTPSPLAGSSSAPNPHPGGLTPEATDNGTRPTSSQFQQPALQPASHEQFVNTSPTPQSQPVDGASNAQFPANGQLFALPWMFDEAPFYDPMYMWNVQNPGEMGYGSGGFS